MKVSIICCIVLFIPLMMMFTYNDTSDKSEVSDSKDIVSLRKHWEIAIPNQVVPDRLVSLSAKDCGDCHQDIYDEWKKSTHAIAFQDLQFQTEWKKDNVTVCLNCHTPLQNQQEFIVTGLLNGDYKTPVKTINPYFDKSLQQEGITCASCHVRNGNVIGISENTNAPHKMIRDADFLSDKLCINCHNVIDELNDVLVCTFETGDEWKNSRASKSGKTCITCHMSKIERPIASGFDKIISHSHYFAGSGIPKVYGMDVKGLNGLQIKTANLKKEYAVDEKLIYSLVLKNSFAGHKVSTGDPERFFLITFKVLDANNNILDEKQYRIGEEWQWYPVAKKLSDNNLAPLEERTFDFSYQIPDKNLLILVVEITKYRMTKENAAFMGILEKYPLSISVFKQSYPINLKK